MHVQSKGARYEQQEFLDRYYGVAHRIYDVTRKHYLLGRDRAIDELLERPWRTLVEVGPGTGRNLRRIHEARPWARLAGLEPARPMREHARERCPWATFLGGFAEDARLGRFFGAPPDRVLFSYCLSMVPDPAGTLRRLRGQLGAKSEILVVDFADGAGLPSLARRALHRWLEAFHAKPLKASIFDDASSVQFGPGRYYAIARYRRLRSVT